MANGLFGEGITFDELVTLFKAIRERNLTLQIKIGDGPWENLSPVVIMKMTTSISSGTIRESNDIRLRLFAKTN